MDDLGLLRYETILNWVAATFYLFSTIVFAYSIFFEKKKGLNGAIIAALSGLLFHTIALGMRWAIAGHPPYIHKYEILTSGVWTAVIIFLILVWRYPWIRATGVIVMPLNLLLLTFALFSNPEVRVLPAGLRSMWLHIHAVANALAGGAIILAIGASVVYILKENRGDSGFYGMFPSLSVLDEYAYKFTAFAFIFWGIVIVSGSIWANEAWGRYWGWDPLETWSLITWLMFGLYLHLRYFFKWKGRRAACVMTICFILSVLTLYILPFMIESLHSQYFVS